MQTKPVISDAAGMSRAAWIALATVCVVPALAAVLVWVG